jgi:hypothetical protein
MIWLRVSKSLALEISLNNSSKVGIMKGENLIGERV